MVRDSLATKRLKGFQVLKVEETLSKSTEDQEYDLVKVRQLFTWPTFFLFWKIDGQTLGKHHSEPQHREGQRVHLSGCEL